MKKPNKQLMIVTDLDGTLLDEKRCVSSKNYQTLELAGEMGIIRTVATGRSLFNARKALPEDFPVEYLIFSTGSGIMNWQTKEIIYTEELTPKQVQRIITVLDSLAVDYMLHTPIPDNHYFYWRHFSGNNQDFMERLHYFRDYAKDWDQWNPNDPATQFVIIVPQEREEVFALIQEQLDEVTIIKTTSPIDLRSLWIEIMPETVSKGKGIQHLISLLHIPMEQVMTIGNDYNDEDMIAITPHGYVVSNAPLDMLSKYQQVAHHLEDGFTEAFYKFIEAHSEELQ